MPDSLSAAQKRLTRARARQRRQQLGPPLQQSDADLTTLSEVGPHDLAAVESFIRDAAGQRGVDMLRAK